MTIRGLQALRGIAACAVVYSHAYSRAERAWNTPHFPDTLTQIGHFGVDLFFVLSGFLMVYLHEKDFGHPGAPGKFFKRRVQRIVPLYWILSTLGLALLIVAPRLFTYFSHIEIPWALGCFAFIPWPMSNGFWSPIIGAGWTLDYEMYFYVLFALALLFSRGLTLLVGLMVAAILVGVLWQPEHPWLHLLSSPMLAEFLMGAWVARTRMPRAVAIAALVVAPVAIALGGQFYIGAWDQDLERVAFWGIPSAMIVASVVTLNPRCDSPLGRILVRLGDASYSIYLSQVLALPAAAIALRFAHIQALPIHMRIALLWIAACAAGVLCWAVLERPIQRYFRHLSQSRRDEFDLVAIGRHSCARVVDSDTKGISA